MQRQKLIKEHNITDKQKKQFNKIFNTDFEDFRDIIGNQFDLGLNIIQFDKWLNVPSGISTYNFIKGKYGETAAKLIATMLKP